SPPVLNLVRSLSRLFLRFVLPACRPAFGAGGALSRGPAEGSPMSTEKSGRPRWLELERVLPMSEVEGITSLSIEHQPASQRESRRAVAPPSRHEAEGCLGDCAR